MSLSQTTTNAAGLVVGSAASTNPLWLNPDWLIGPYQAVMAVGGLLVLALTLRKLWRENQALDAAAKSRNGPKEP